MATIAGLEAKEYNRIQQRYRTAKHKILGLCVTCSEPAEPGKVQCARHLKVNTESAIRIRKQRIANNICINCGGTTPATPGRQYCESCALKEKADRRERIAQGLCGNCSRPLPPNSRKVTCDLCVAKMMTRRTERIANGYCSQCLAVKVPEGETRCPRCVVKASQISKKRYQDLLAKGLCVTCGKRERGEGSNVIQCGECRAASKVFMRERYWEHTGKGLCARCKEKAKEGTSLCPRHHQENSQGMKKKYYLRKAQGLCVQCGRTSRPNMTTCQRCADKAKASINRRRLARKKNQPVADRRRGRKVLT